MSQPSKISKARYRERNREALRTKGRIYYKSYRNTEQNRDAVLLRRYGITSAQYRDLLTIQNNLCALCEQPEKVCKDSDKIPQSLAVDHNHTTGEIRGLLCYRCNLTLGVIEKDLEFTNKILAYLSKSKA